MDPSWERSKFEDLKCHVRWVLIHGHLALRCSWRIDWYCHFSALHGETRGLNGMGWDGEENKIGESFQGGIDTKSHMDP